MPFRVAIAWGREDYLVSSSFGVTMDPVTIAYFENKDKSPIEEPKYIILATPKGQISKGYYYVIADGLFYKADEIFGPEVTSTPKPTRTPNLLRPRSGTGCEPQRESGSPEDSR